MARRHETEGVDRRLREVLAPQPGQVGRVVESALCVPETRRRPRLPLIAAAAAAVLVLALAAALLVPALRRDEPILSRAASRHSVSNRDGIVVVRSLDGGATSLRSGERPSQPPRGMMLIVRGETRP